MIWKRAVADGLYKCGSCRTPIAAGELVAFTKTRLERCEPCGRQIEEPHDIEEDETGVPPGVTHQPSMGFGGERNRMVSTSELARRHASSHFQRRTRR